MILVLCLGFTLGWMAMLALVVCDRQHITVDRFWMENAERWEWLRQHETKAPAARGSEDG